VVVDFVDESVYHRFMRVKIGVQLAKERTIGKLCAASNSGGRLT